MAQVAIGPLGRGGEEGAMLDILGLSGPAAVPAATVRAGKPVLQFLRESVERLRGGFREPVGLAGGKFPFRGPDAVNDAFDSAQQAVRNISQNKNIRANKQVLDRAEDVIRMNSREAERGFETIEELRRLGFSTDQIEAARVAAEARESIFQGALTRNRNKSRAEQTAAANRAFKKAPALQRIPDELVNDVRVLDEAFPFTEFGKRELPEAPMFGLGSEVIEGGEGAARQLAMQRRMIDFIQAAKRELGFEP